MSTALAARTVTAMHVVKARRAGRGLRGVTFIEYALLAGIAVLVAIIFRKNLSSIFSNLMGDLSGAVGDTGTP